MPTGYTSPIYEGKEITFEELVLRCARNFGALMPMRDSPIDEPIPDEFEPSDYFQKALEKEQEKYENFIQNPKTDEEYEQLYNEYVQMAKEEFETREKRISELRVKYNEMILKAVNWKSPTPDHDNLKSFVISQLQDSLEADCASYAPRIATNEEWIEHEKDPSRFTKQIEYYTENRDKEIQAARSRTKWVKELKESLTH